MYLGNAFDEILKARETFYQTSNPYMPSKFHSLELCFLNIYSPNTFKIFPEIIRNFHKVNHFSTA